MFEFDRYSDEQLIEMQATLRATRANPLEQLAAIMAMGCKIAVDRALTARRTAAAAAAVDAAKTAGGKSAA